MGSLNIPSIVSLRSQVKNAFPVGPSNPVA
jgi:hypothetical protein